MILNQKDYLAYIKGLMNPELSCARPLKLFLSFFPEQQLENSVKLCEGTRDGYLMSHVQSISTDFNECLELVGGRFGSSSSVAG